MVTLISVRYPLISKQAYLSYEMIKKYLKTLTEKKINFFVVVYSL